MSQPPAPGSSMHEVRARTESAVSLAAWMRQRLAAELGVDPAALALDRPLAEHGVSSRVALGLLGDLERRLGRRLPETLPWDHPTLHALAQALAGGEARPRPTPPATSATASPTAVVGLACRFPGASDPTAFWELLRGGRDAVAPAPAQRRSLLACPDPEALGLPAELAALPGGWLSDVDGFDAAFFGIVPGEAAAMDPQHRLLLEVTLDALDDAGIPASELAGRRVGVFVGISTGDYAQLQLAEPGRWCAHSGTGTAASIAANRISYLLDLRGPSLTVDTACSSSLVAVHLACESLARGECELALAAGVNLVLSPALTIILARGGFLSPGGRCRAFDTAADGYVRGEGCGAIVLAPLERAQERRDRVRAVVRGTAVAQDGRTNGLTAPSRPAQEALLREAYRRAGVEPSAVAYVEAHGSGTALGDTLELAALGAVVGRGRPRERACRVGSVKSNIGHLEAAAGIAGLIKAVLALDRCEIPPSLHCHQPNPRVDLAAAGLEVVRESIPWPAGLAGLAGVSSFGFGGTLAHAVLERYVARPLADEGPPATLLLPVSARSGPALAVLAASYRAQLSGLDLAETAAICRAAARRRDHHPARLAVTGASAAELARALQAIAAVAPGRAASPGTEPPGLAFVFAGLGGQRTGTGRELFEVEPAFRRAFLQAADLVGAAGGPDLVTGIRSSGEQRPLDDPAAALPSLLVLQVALVGLLQEWGIQPDAVVGCGAGEIAAAWASGVLTLAEAAELAVRLGSEAQTLTNPIELQVPLVPRSSGIPMVSAVTGEPIDGRDLATADWERKVREPARFTAAVERLAAMRLELFLALGPDGALLPGIRESLEPGRTGGSEPRAWAALLPGREREALLEAVGGLWTAGRPVDWSGLHRGAVAAVPLPRYPWQHESYWLEPVETRATGSARPSTWNQRLGPPVGVAPDLFFWQLELDAGRLPWLRHHRLNGVPVLPVSAFVELGRQAAAAALGIGAWAVADLVMERTLALPDGETRCVQVVLRREFEGRAQFGVFAREGEQGGWVEHGRGRLECASG